LKTEPLGPLSEMLALSAYANTKNLLITAIETRGPLDTDTMAAAIKKAVNNYPKFGSVLREHRKRFKHELVWERKYETVPLKVREAHGRYPGKPALDLYFDAFSDDLDRDWDLFSEPPAEMHLLRLGDEHQIFAPVIHHAVSDAATASEFGREILANYHELATGSKPEWALVPHAVSTTRKRMVKAKTSGLRLFCSDFRDTLSRLFERPAAPTGSGAAADIGRHHVRFVLTEHETNLITRNARKRGASLIDLLVEGSNRAVDQWNLIRGIRPGSLSTAVSVNMKGRYREFDGQNNSGQIFFRSRPAEREDDSNYAKSIALERIKQFRNQMDMKFFTDVHRLMISVSFLPFRLRRPVVHRIMDMHRFSVAVTLLGVIWPELKNGKPTGASCLLNSGGMAITDIYGIGYKLLSSTQVLLIVYVFRNKLNLMLHASAESFNREEAEEFLKLIVKQVAEK
jgi:hypothetical protein